MDSYERFKCACSHQQPDRPPINYLAHPVVDEKVRQYYNAETEEQLLDHLGCDFYYLSCRDISQNESSTPCYRGPELHRTQTERVCPLGIRWTRGAYGSKFAVDEAVQAPLVNATSQEDIFRHSWPRADWFDFEPLLAECESHGSRVKIGGLWSGIFGDSYRMLGFENFLFKMAAEPEIIKTLVNRMTDFYLEANDRMFSLLKGKLDVFFFGNDFGTQNGLLFSRPMWEQFFYENIKSLASLGHSHGLKVMMHSCGAISELVPLLIEAGVDILDPIQSTAAGMDVANLKNSYGDKVVFHGAMDTQRVLPRESPEVIDRHVAELIRVLGRDGGYIFAPCNNIQPDTPVENVVAMYRTAGRN